mmetsp:Transcript_8996/g.10111  ORF Transcript_8996/g.10111 Transcript_8996/m.10111 type:complete len:479 (+) Transcript_8996:49-1485(+)
MVVNSNAPLDGDGSPGDYLIEKKISFRLTKWRWVGLALGCFVVFGGYFSSDNPQALESELEASPYDLSRSDFNLLYSSYAAPDIVLTLVGGVIVDALGVRIGLLAFSFLIVVGQGLFALGIGSNAFWLMLTGRAIFGIGSDCLSIAQSTIVSKWFKGKELAFALGMNISIGRLGSSLNSFISPKIYTWSGDVWLPCLIGCILCGVSSVGAIFLAYMDREADRREGVLQVQEKKTDQENVGEGEEQEEEESIFSFKAVKSFKLIFWLLLLNCGLIYTGFYAFTNQANLFLQKRFGLSNDEAGGIIPIIYLVAAVITPLFGLLTDKIGKRSLIMIFSTALLCVAHGMFVWLPNYNGSYICILPVSLFGIFYATYAAIFWPCVPLVMPEKYLGTGFGLITAFQDLVLTVVPLILGSVQDATSDHNFGFYWSEFILFFVSIAGLVCTFLIFFNDLANGGVLMKPTQKESKSNRASVRASLKR